MPNFPRSTGEGGAASSWEQAKERVPTHDHSQVPPHTHTMPSPMHRVQVQKGKVGQQILPSGSFLVSRPDPLPAAWAIPPPCPTCPGIQMGSALTAQLSQVLT